MKNLQFLSLVLILSFGCTFQNKENKKPTNEQIKTEQSSSLENIHQFTSKSGEPIGSLFVKKLPEENDVFPDMYIISKIAGLNDTIYSIEGSTLKNKEGIDIQIRKQDFYGYKIVFKDDTYVELIALHNKGKEVSDIIHIQWIDSKKGFEVLQAP